MPCSRRRLWLRPSRPWWDSKRASYTWPRTGTGTTTCRALQPRAVTRLCSIRTDRDRPCPPAAPLPPPGVCVWLRRVPAATLAPIHTFCASVRTRAPFCMFIVLSRPASTRYSATTCDAKQIRGRLLPRCAKRPAPRAVGNVAPLQLSACALLLCCRQHAVPKLSLPSQAGLCMGARVQKGGINLKTQPQPSGCGGD